MIVGLFTILFIGVEWVVYTVQVIVNRGENIRPLVDINMKKVQDKITKIFFQISVNHRKRFTVGTTKINTILTQSVTKICFSIFSKFKLIFEIKSLTVFS